MNQAVLLYHSIVMSPELVVIHLACQPVLMTVQSYVLNAMSMASMFMPVVVLV